MRDSGQFVSEWRRSVRRIVGGARPTLKAAEQLCCHPITVGFNIADTACSVIADSNCRREEATASRPPTKLERPDVLLALRLGATHEDFVPRASCPCWGMARMAMAPLLAAKGHRPSS